MVRLEEEYMIDPGFTPWGPFISPAYHQEPITKSDIIIASIVWGLTILNACIALFLGINQTKASRAPWRSVYIWMIWVELIVSFAMGMECYFHLLKLIRPSFAFYFSILFFWCIQVQLLLQIVINRIRVIIPDRKRSRAIMIGTAIFVTVINISVFNIWIPARLQIDQKYCDINAYWDRIEKGLYLIVDAGLNIFFLRTVRLNLIANGLTKYDQLVCFNRKIVVFSLLMDIMIIAAMSIPNSFVYMQFHPLAYLVKLNIEMTMANLIKRIAISTSCKTGKMSIAEEFKASESPRSTSFLRIGERLRNICGANLELTNVSWDNSVARHFHTNNSVVSYLPTGNQIKETREVIVSNEPNPFFKLHRRLSDAESIDFLESDTGAEAGLGRRGVMLEFGHTAGSQSDKSTSLDGSTVRSKSVESTPKAVDTDDEAALVWQKYDSWTRKDG